MWVGTCTDIDDHKRVAIDIQVSWGILADEAESGLEVIEMLREVVRNGHAYDLAVLDLHLADMGGFDISAGH